MKGRRGLSSLLVAAAFSSTWSDRIQERLIEFVIVLLGVSKGRSSQRTNKPESPSCRIDMAMNTVRAEKYKFY